MWGRTPTDGARRLIPSVEVLGVDIGGVVIQRTGDAGEDDTSFWGPNYLDTPEVDDAMATIGALARGRFGDAVHLSPMLIIIAFVVGGYLGGILGLFVAVPVAATLRILFQYAHERVYA